MAFKIEFARGDSYERGIGVREKGEQTPLIADWDDIYFTVKSNFKNKNYVLQKRLSDGTIQDDGNGHYTLFIRPEDTNDLQFGDYDCDFEFKKDELTKTFTGALTLTKEVTHSYNE